MSDQASSKHANFIIRSQEPLNGGPPLPALAATAMTPNDLFFVRNHGSIPQIDPAVFRLEIGGMVQRPLTLALADLRGLPRASVAATLQCAGNRRDELSAVAPTPGELPWGAEAISSAVWEGVPLREILRAAGIDTGATHVAFTSSDDVERSGRHFGFGGSLPLAKALAPEVLLADTMNGAPLPAEHGFPLRVVAPGYIGARSVKWLQTITLQTEPSDNYFQAHAYKLFPTDITAQNVDWQGGMMLGEQSLTSVICDPATGAKLAAGPVLLRGYAYAGGDRSVERVEVSADGGTCWQQAELLGQPERWAWRLWQARIDVPPGRHTLAVRAWDSAAQTQPSEICQVWNFKGYMNNAWHRIAVEAVE